MYISTNAYGEKDFLFSEADKRLQKKALAIKIEKPGVSMRKIASDLNVSMQKLKQLLEPIGEWLPQQRANDMLESSMKVFPSRQKTNILKKKFKDGVITCMVCGITEWLGVPIANILQTDHIDGNHGNNTPSNLRAVCPNCHSQTTTRFKNMNRSLNETDISKKNMITSLDDITPNMKKRLKDQSGEAKRTPKNRIPLEDILAGNVPTYRTQRLVDRLIGAGFKKPCCENCGNTTWRGIQIGLFLHGHHKNGSATDHRLDNIEILCPNCHSLDHRHELTTNPSLVGQQATFLSANPIQLNINAPEVQEVIKLFDDSNRPRSMAKCADKLGMTERKFKTIALKLGKWEPAAEPHRRLNLNDPEVAKQAKIIKELQDNPAHTKYGQFGLTKAMKDHNMQRKRYLALYDRVKKGAVSKS